MSWDDGHGLSQYTHGKFIDVSEAGLQIEVPVSIPVRTNVALNAERIKLSGSAIVKHLVRRGSKYVVGLELSQLLREETLAAIRRPLATIV